MNKVSKNESFFDTCFWHEPAGSNGVKEHENIIKLKPRSLNIPLLET